jgi:hypothetical protein
MLGFYRSVMDFEFEAVGGCPADRGGADVTRLPGRPKRPCAGVFGPRLWLRDRRERAFARPV